MHVINCVLTYISMYTRWRVIYITICGFKVYITIRCVVYGIIVGYAMLRYNEKNESHDMAHVTWPFNMRKKNDKKNRWFSYQYIYKTNN